MEDKTEEIVAEVPFLSDNDKWAGRVQILRVTLPQADGTTRTFVNKRLMFTRNRRYINLPRKNWEEIVEAITKASALENSAHEELLHELNAAPPNTMLLSSRRSKS